ncbi:MAG: DNA-binding protein [Bacteroidales bacterium]|nr:DNA-binding protein [Bacteroidales bacterium]
MAIKLKTVQKHNPLDKDAPSKFYANAVHEKKVNLADISKKVSKRCSFREADVLGVLTQTLVIFVEEVSEGTIVSLGDLGSFYVNVASEGAESAEKLTPGMVKGCRLIYKPSKELRKQLRLVDVSIPSAS